MPQHEFDALMRKLESRRLWAAGVIDWTLAAVVYASCCAWLLGR